MRATGSGRVRKAAEPASKRVSKVAEPAVLVCAATVRAKAVKRAFAPLCGKDLRLVEEARHLAKRGENGPVLAVVSAPVGFVAARLGEGLAPAAALGAWLEITAQLRALKKSRRKVVLLDDRALVTPEAGLPATLAERLGFAFALPEVPADTAPAGPLSALAYALLTTDPDMSGPLAAWQREVLGPDGIGFERDDARLAARGWQPDGSQAGAQRAALLQEINAQQVGQIEAATRRIAELEAREAAARAETAVLRASIQALEHRLAEAGTRRRGLEAVAGAQILADGAALAAAEAELGRLRQELEKVFSSTSWKLTEPLRASQRLLGR